jgi:hypothetical protein
MDSAPIIRIKQTGGPVYTFEKSWARTGGNLFGDNFLTDICTRGCISGDRAAVHVEVIDGDYVCSSIETDPDFLLFLWKKGRGERFDFYITESEVLFLYEFYRANGFNCMLVDIEAASDRLEKRKQFTCLVC